MACRVGMANQPACLQVQLLHSNCWRSGQVVAAAIDVVTLQNIAITCLLVITLQSRSATAPAFAAVPPETLTSLQLLSSKLGKVNLHCEVLTYIHGLSGTV